MTYGSIIVQLDIDASPLPRLTFARQLAQRFGAHLIAFSSAAGRIVPSEDSGLVAPQYMQLQIEEIEQRLGVIEHQVRDFAKDQGPISWRGRIGDPTSLLALECRAADLVVTGAASTAVDELRTVDAGALVLSAGRPILLAADDHAPLQAESLLVAWKDTREARRAVSDALPFLTSARQVVVATIAGGDQQAARDSTADVVRFLGRHGAKARAEVIDAGDADTSLALIEMARDAGADLVVAGGYGHSRLREWAFGGVSRSLLRHGTIHRLLAN